MHSVVPNSHCMWMAATAVDRQPSSRRNVNESSAHRLSLWSVVDKTPLDCRTIHWCFIFDVFRKKETSADQQQQEPISEIRQISKRSWPCWIVNRNATFKPNSSAALRAAANFWRFAASANGGNETVESKFDKEAQEEASQQFCRF